MSTSNWHDFLAIQEDEKRIIEASHPRSGGWPGLEKSLIASHPFCAFCGEASGKTKLVGHHILPYHLYPQWELEEWNIMVVGETCSTGHHHLLLGHYGNFRKWNPDARRLASIMLTNRQRILEGFEPLPMFTEIVPGLIGPPKNA